MVRATVKILKISTKVVKINLISRVTRRKQEWRKRQDLEEVAWEIMAAILEIGGDACSQEFAIIAGKLSQILLI